MKKYLVFFGDAYYPSGGWFDFRGSFDSVQDALEHIANQNDYDWYQIVDRDTATIVKECI